MHDGHFDRDRMPSIGDYCEGNGLPLKGRTKWCTTRCDIHGGSDSLRVNVVTNAWRCMACDAKGGDTLSLHMALRGIGFLEAAQDLGCWVNGPPVVRSPAEEAAIEAKRQELQRQRLEEQARKWRDNQTRNDDLARKSVVPAPDDPPSLYLARRLGQPIKPPAAIRYHRALGYFDEFGNRLGVFATMLAELVNHEGERVCWHRTYLLPDGQKAPVPQPKKLTAPSGRVLGSAIRLFPFDPEDGRLAVSEGLETALSVHLLTGLPVWAVYSAPNLAAFEWPEGVRHLLIYGDHDHKGAGQRAARELEARARTAGISARVVLPTEPGTDWNDIQRNETEARELSEEGTPQ